MPKSNQRQLAELSTSCRILLQKLAKKSVLNKTEQEEIISKLDMLCELARKESAIKLGKEKNEFFTRMLLLLKKQLEQLQNGTMVNSSHVIFSDLMQIMQDIFLDNLPPGVLSSELVKKINDVYSSGENIAKIWNSLSSNEKIQMTMGLTITLVGIGLLIASLANPAFGMAVLAGICIAVGVAFCKKALEKHHETEAVALSKALGHLATCTGILTNTASAQGLVQGGIQALSPTLMGGTADHKPKTSVHKSHRQQPPYPYQKKRPTDD
jgi:hypothetical protein